MAMEGNAYFLCGKRGEKMANTNKKPDWWYDKKRWQGMPGGGPATGGNQKQKKRQAIQKPSRQAWTDTTQASEASRRARRKARLRKAAGIHRVKAKHKIKQTVRMSLSNRNGSRAGRAGRPALWDLIWSRRSNRRDS